MLTKEYLLNLRQNAVAQQQAQGTIDLIDHLVNKLVEAEQESANELQ
jgi:hypothetical protein